MLLYDFKLILEHLILIRIDSAIAHLKEHPEQSYRQVAAQYDIAYSTLHDRANKKHLSHPEGAHKNLSTVQEHGLIQEINTYADRGTLLTPAHIKSLAEKLCGHPVGVNWPSTFISRHKQEISSRFYRVQEASRIQADTPAHRLAFYKLVGTFTFHPAASEGYL